MKVWEIIKAPTEGAKDWTGNKSAFTPRALPSVDGKSGQRAVADIRSKMKAR